MAFHGAPPCLSETGCCEPGEIEPPMTGASVPATAGRSATELRSPEKLIERPSFGVRPRTVPPPHRPGAGPRPGERSFDSLACARRQTGIAASSRLAPALGQPDRAAPQVALDHGDLDQPFALRACADCATGSIARGPCAGPSRPACRRTSPRSAPSGRAAPRSRSAPASSRSRNWVMRRAARRLFQPAQASTSARASRAQGLSRLPAACS